MFVDFSIYASLHNRHPRWLKASPKPSLLDSRLASDSVSDTDSVTEGAQHCWQAAGDATDCHEPGKASDCHQAGKASDCHQAGEASKQASKQASSRRSRPSRQSKRREKSVHGAGECTVAGGKPNWTAEGGRRRRRRGGRGATGAPRARQPAAQVGAPGQLLPLSRKLSSWHHIYIPRVWLLLLLAAICYRAFR
jgi:hypothetical protein